MSTEVGGTIKASSVLERAPCCPELLNSVFSVFCNWRSGPTGANDNHYCLSRGGVTLQGGVADTIGSESVRSHVGGVVHCTAPRLPGEFSRLGAPSCEGRDRNGRFCLSVEGMSEPPQSWALTPPPAGLRGLRGAAGFVFPEGGCIIDVEGIIGAVGSAG